MDFISGNVKRYDGINIDFVRIFEWDTGYLVSIKKPDINGDWRFDAISKKTIGVMYISNGCVPILFGKFMLKPKPPIDYILLYKFDGDYLDSSSNLNDGLATGNVGFSDGRTAGTQSVSFSGGMVKSKNNIVYNSNKLTISFWLKNPTTSRTSIIYESSENYNAAGIESFVLYKEVNNIYNYSTNGYNGYNLIYNTMDIIDTWFNITITVDRSQSGVNEQKLYINGVFTPTKIDLHTSDGSRNFSNLPIYIGNRGIDRSLYYSGKIQDFYIYNRVLSIGEILALYEN